MTQDILGRPLKEALSSLPAGAQPPRIVETAAPLREGQPPREGTQRVVACRDEVWITARFADALPERKHEA